jgi:hypothetical protein
MKYNKYAVKGLSTVKKISEIIKFKVTKIIRNFLRNYQALEAKLVTVCCGKCFSLHNLYANLCGTDFRRIEGIVPRAQKKKTNALQVPPPR